MSPLAQFVIGSSAGLGVLWVLWVGFKNDDPFEEFCNDRAPLVALRESYEKHGWASEQLVEIRNLPETDPWRAA